MLDNIIVQWCIWLIQEFEAKGHLGVGNFV